jgi:hypothetical protein
MLCSIISSARARCAVRITKVMTEVNFTRRRMNHGFLTWKKEDRKLGDWGRVDYNFKSRHHLNLLVGLFET